MCSLPCLIWETSRSPRKRNILRKPGGIRLSTPVPEECNAPDGHTREEHDHPSEPMPLEAGFVCRIGWHVLFGEIPFLVRKRLLAPLAAAALKDAEGDQIFSLKIW